MSRGDSKRTGFAREIVWETYQKGITSKTALAARLGISMPTVLQTVRGLLACGILTQSGQLESKGGRKADALTLNGERCFAIGADITRSHLSLVAIDLRGELRWHERLTLPFANDAAYGEAFQRALNRFRVAHGIELHRLLGVGISLPGILSANGRALAESHALRVTNYPLAALEQGCECPTLAVNDANAAALAEKHLLPPAENMAYLSLSDSVGGAVFIGGSLYTGDHGRGAEFGHMPVVPDGRECYCGKLGCFDAYCSALRLSEPYRNRLADFFQALSSGESAAAALWDSYCRYLALMCNHLRMVFDCPVVLGGYVGAYLEPYLERIMCEAARLNTFEPSGSYVRCCRYKTEAAAVGAALMHIERFLDDVRV